MKKLSLNNKKIFILGGCGLLGSEIVSLFSKTAKKIIILDLKKKRENIKKRTC